MKILKNIKKALPKASLMNNQHGSILALALFCLLILSILGTFAISTSTYEINIAGNQQKWEENFNTTEGAVNKEGFSVGYAGIIDQLTGKQIAPWYQISDPENFNDILYPTVSGEYDPSGNDMPDPDFLAAFDPLVPPGVNDTDTWPRQNLLSITTDDQYDYAYLVTYLYPDTPPKGTDATKFASYKFRINGQRQVIIELGGIKVGVKNPL